jgi:hypothetical protein
MEETPSMENRMETKPILASQKDKIMDIARRHGATGIKVFGSIARGEGSSTSDLDLLLNMEPGRSLLDIIAIKQDLEDLLGISVDVVTENSLSPYARDAILGEAVPL